MTARIVNTGIKTRTSFAKVQLLLESFDCAYFIYHLPILETFLSNCQ